jgi:hypothetical protein
MSSLPLPPWLELIFPGWYTDLRDGKLIPLTDEEVLRLFQQHWVEQQQQWRNMMRQQQARQVPHEVCQQYQAQYQPSTCIYSTPTGRLEMKANT